MYVLDLFCIATGGLFCVCYQNSVPTSFVQIGNYFAKHSLLIFEVPFIDGSKKSLKNKRYPLGTGIFLNFNTTTQQSRPRLLQCPPLGCNHNLVSSIHRTNLPLNSKYAITVGCQQIHTPLAYMIINNNKVITKRDDHTTTLLLKMCAQNEWNV